MDFRHYFSRISRPAAVSALSVMALVLGASAGSLTPSGIPAATMYSLAEIYDSIVGTFNSSSIVANQNGSLMENLKYIESQVVWASGSNNVWNLNPGNVGIGTTAPETKFEVVGAASVSNLVVSQTQTTAGHSAFGNSANIDEPFGFPGYAVVNVREHLTDGSQYYVSGMESQLIIDPDVDPTASYIGTAGTAITADANTADFSTSFLSGGSFYARHSGTGDFYSITGVSGTGQQDGPFGSNAQYVYGVSGAVYASNFGSITNAYSLYAAAPFATSPITNLYGLYVEDTNLSGIANPYNIYSVGAGSRNYFAGNASIGGNFELAGYVSNNWLPRLDSSYALGDATHRWANLFATNASVSGTLEVNIASVSQLYVAGSQWGWPLEAPAGSITSPSFAFDNARGMGVFRSGTTMLLQSKNATPDLAGRSRLSLGDEFFSLAANRAENASANGTLQCFDEGGSFPICRFDVYDGTNLGTTRFMPTQVTFSTGASISGNFDPGADSVYDLGSSANRWRSLYVSSASLHIGTSGNEATIGYETSGVQGLTFKPDGTTVLFVGDSGRAGVGTASPSSLFEISGIASPSLTIMNSDTPVTGNIAGRIDFSAYSYIMAQLAQASIWAVEDNTGHSGGSGSLHFGTRTGLLVYEGMTLNRNAVNGTAALGVNQTDPRATVDIRGGSQTSPGRALRVTDAFGVQLFAVDNRLRVSIGTTASSSVLQLASGWTGTTNPQVIFSGIDNEAETIAFTIRDENGSDYFRVGSDGLGDADRGKIFVAGRLAVGGTNSPDQKLDVTGNILASTSGNVSLILHSSSAFGTDGQFSILSASTSDRLDFRGGTGLLANTLMSIASSGNVGIGDSTPEAMLEVGGVASFSNVFRVGAPGTGTIYLNHDTGGSSTATMIMGSGVTVYGAGNDFRAAAINGTYIFDGGFFSSNPNPVSLGFRWGYGSGPFGVTQQMILSAGGNLGIAATSPDQRLDVSGNILASASGNVDLILNSTTSNDAKFTIRSVGASDRLDILGSASQAYLSILDNGNIGIGTTNPTEQISVLRDVNGPNMAIFANPNAGIFAYQELSIRNGASYIDGLRLMTMGTGFTTAGAFQQDSAVINAEEFLSGGLNLLARGASAPIRFYAGGYLAGNERMHIESGGNIGIGTSTPAAKLDVAGSIFASAVGNVDVTLRSTSATSDDGLFALRSAGASDRLDFLGGSGLLNTFMSIASTGNVGIGTTVPQGPLDVRGRTFFDNEMTMQTAGTDVGYVTYSGSPLRFLIFAAAGRQLAFGANNTLDQMTIDTTGNVGIGSTTPVQKLQVAGDVRVGTGATGCVEDADGTVIAGTCSSDERLKKEIEPLGGVLERLTQLEPSTYYWRSEEYPERHWGSQEQIGLIAQQVQEYMPELVVTSTDGFLQVRYSDLPMYLLQGIREVAVKTTTLDALIAEHAVLLDDGGPLSKLVRNIVAYLADVMGIELTTNRVRVQELCLDDVCVNKAQLKTLLEHGGVDAVPSATPTPASSGEPDATVSPSVTVSPEISASPSASPEAATTPSPTESPEPSILPSEPPTASPEPSTAP